MSTSEVTSNPKPIIAYLSPAFPALSETFVYEELLAIERKGYAVVPFSVHRPKAVVPAQAELARRVIHLYAPSHIYVVATGIARLLSFGTRSLLALKMLCSDIWELGILRAQSWKLVYQFLAAAKLARMLIDKKCRHLHVHFADTPGQIAMYASALSGVPFTVMAHANDIYGGGILLQRKAERAARLLTISEFNCRHLERLGIAPQRIALIRCGVSFIPVQKEVSKPQVHGPFRIGTLGRMVEKKGFDVLIRAVALLTHSGAKLELHIAGDGPLRPDLEKLVRDLGVAQSVVFEGGLQHEQVAPWMQTMQVFVLACKKSADGDMDGIPVVLMEAMSQSVPVISTRLSGIPELVIHNETGLLATPGEVQPLAVQLQEMILSPELQERLARTAYLHVTNEFSQSLNIDRLIKQIELTFQHLKSCPNATC